jgi:hypothetical protein
VEISKGLCAGGQRFLRMESVVKFYTTIRLKSGNGLFTDKNVTPFKGEGKSVRTIPFLCFVIYVCCRCQVKLEEWCCAEIRDLQLEVRAKGFSFFIKSFLHSLKSHFSDEMWQKFDNKNHGFGVSWSCLVSWVQGGEVMLMGESLD